MCGILGLDSWLCGIVWPAGSRALHVLQVELQGPGGAHIWATVHYIRCRQMVGSQVHKSLGFKDGLALHQKAGLHLQQA